MAMSKYLLELYDKEQSILTQLGRIGGNTPEMAQRLEREAVIILEEIRRIERADQRIAIDKDKEEEDTEHIKKVLFSRI